MNIFLMWFTKDPSLGIPEELVICTKSLMRFLKSNDKLQIIVNQYFTEFPMEYQVLYTDLFDEVDCGYIDKCQSYNHKSDYIRTVIMNRYPGIYFDMDCFHIRDFHPLFDLPLYDYVAMYDMPKEWGHLEWVNVGIMCNKVPGLLTGAVNNLRKKLDSKVYNVGYWNQLFKVISSYIYNFVPNKIIHDYIHYYRVVFKDHSNYQNKGYPDSLIDELAKDERIYGVCYMKSLTNWTEDRKSRRLDFTKRMFERFCKE